MIIKNLHKKYCKENGLKIEFRFKARNEEVGSTYISFNKKLNKWMIYNDYKWTSKLYQKSAQDIYISIDNRFC